MSEHILSIITYALEAMAELSLIRSLLGKGWKALWNPYLLFIPISSILNEFLYYLFPNIFGWLLAFPVCIVAYKFILHIRIVDCLFPFLLSFTMYGIFESISILLIPKSAYSLSNSLLQLIGTGIMFLITITISCFPLAKLYLRIKNSLFTLRLLISYLCLLCFTSVAISKINTIDFLSFLPITVSFMLILLLADILVMKQQQTITTQQQNITNYQTYAPMANELIADILGKQHDFNNQMNAIRMLPYTYKDYDTLSQAISQYSTQLEEEFNGSELLKISLPVVAGFIFSKQKYAEQNRKGLIISIKNKTLHTIVPEYDLIRMFGILIDNALEAIGTGEEVSLVLDSRDNHILFSTENEGPHIGAELREKIFTRGYSTKVSADKHSSRGFGLNNLKALVDRYDGKLYLENITVDNRNHIRFSVEV